MWNNSMPSMDESFQSNQQLTSGHLQTANEVIEAYNDVIGLGEACLKLANYMINSVKTTISFIDAEIIKIFEYTSIS